MKQLYVVLFFFLSQISLKAQVMLTFSECLEIIYSRNLSLKDALISSELGSIHFKESRRNILPSINVNLANNNNSGRSIDPYTNSFTDTNITSFSGGLSGRMLLFNGFSNVNKIRIAKKEVDYNESLIEKLKFDLNIELASLYTNILYFTELIENNHNQIYISNKQLGFLKLKVDQGLISISELYKLEASIASEEVNLKVNENLLTSLDIRLKQLLNMPVSEMVKLVSIDTIGIEVVEFIRNQRDINDFYKKHPVYKMAKTQELKSELGMKLNKSFHYPILSLQFNFDSFYSTGNTFFNFSEQISNNRNYGISLLLSIPVFNGFSTYDKTKEAYLLYTQSVIRTEIEKNSLLKMYTETFSSFETSRLKLDSALKALKYAEKAFDIDQLKLAYGKIGVAEFLVTQKVLANIKEQSIKAKFDYIYFSGEVNFILTDEFNF